MSVEKEKPGHLVGSKEFWNMLLEKAFLALIAWFIMSLIQDVKSLNVTLQDLNQKMAIVVTEISNQKENIKELRDDVGWLQKNSLIKKQSKSE
jgi:cell division protein FtsB